MASIGSASMLYRHWTGALCFDSQHWPYPASMLYRHWTGALCFDSQHWPIPASMIYRNWTGALCFHSQFQVLHPVPVWNRCSLLSMANFIPLTPVLSRSCHADQNPWQKTTLMTDHPSFETIFIRNPTLHIAMLPCKWTLLTKDCPSVKTTSSLITYCALNPFTAMVSFENNQS